jgi:hypothetical protein
MNMCVPVSNPSSSYCRVLSSVFDLGHLKDSDLSYLYYMVVSPRLMKYVSFIMLAMSNKHITDVDLSQYVNVSDIAAAYIATTLAMPLYLSERVPDLYKAWLLEAKNLASKYLTESISYSDLIYKETIINITILKRLMDMPDSPDLENAMNPSSAYDLFYLSQLLKVVRILKNIEYRAKLDTSLQDLYKNARKEILDGLLGAMFIGSEINEKILLSAPLSAQHLRILFSNKEVKTLSIRYFRHAAQDFSMLLKALRGR